MVGPCESVRRIVRADWLAAVVVESGRVQAVVGPVIGEELKLALHWVGPVGLGVVELESVAESVELAGAAAFGSVG